MRPEYSKRRFSCWPGFWGNYRYIDDSVISNTGEYISISEYILLSVARTTLSYIGVIWGGRGVDNRVIRRLGITRDMSRGVDKYV